VYRLPPQSTGGRLLTKSKQFAYENLFTQVFVIEPTVGLTAVLARNEKRLAIKLRKSLPIPANYLKRRSKRHEQLAGQLAWRTVAYQKKCANNSTNVDNDIDEVLGGKKALRKKAFKETIPTPTTHEGYEESKRQARESAYLGQSGSQNHDWIEFKDEDTGKNCWRSKITGDITLEKPIELKSEAEIAFDTKKQARLLRAQVKNS